MSTSSQFGGGGIKSIQRGVITIPGGATLTATATISSVNTSKTEMRFLGARSTSSQVYDLIATVVLTNSTTVTVARLASSVAGIDVSWELTEHY